MNGMNPPNPTRVETPVSHWKIVARFVIILFACFFAVEVGDGAGLRVVDGTLAVGFTMRAIWQVWRLRLVPAKSAQRIYCGVALLGSLTAYASIRGESARAIIMLLILIVCAELIATLVLLRPPRR